LDAFLKRIWEIYGKFTASQLSDLTHQPDTPWYRVWFDQGGSGRKGAAISDDLIYDFFSNKIPKKEAQNPEATKAEGI
jgi:uncharacterized phage-associated protein